MASGGTQIDTVSRGFIQADTTITGKGLRVKLSGSTAYNVTIAGATDTDIGTSGSISSGNGYGTAGDRVDVFLNTKNGTMVMQAAGAITANAPVYPAASGQITGTPNGPPLGLALEAASGAGSYIEVQRLDQMSGAGFPSKIVTVKTANYTVTAADFGTILVANGAGEVDFTLPSPIAANVGAEVEFISQVDQIMGILPTTQGDAFSDGNNNIASAKFQTASHKIAARAKATQITAAIWVIENMSASTLTLA